MESLTIYLIVCPLVFLGGFVDSIAGGGGFISLPAYMMSGLPVHMAIGTNKLSSAMGTSLATYRFAKKGYINLKTAIYCAICALIGSMMGAKTALLIDDKIFKLIMLVILPITGLYVIFNKSLERNKKQCNDEDDFSYKNTLIIAITVALFIGFYDGFYGPGTGTFLMIALTSLAHMTLNGSAGITKVINLTTNITSLCVFLLNGKVMFGLGLVAGFFGIAGNYIGTNLFSDKGVKIVKPLMIVVLSIFFIKLLMETI